MLGTLAQILLKQGVAGFEFAAGIPGSIGGAIRMNAGAYGGEFKDIVEEVTILNEKDKFRLLIIVNAIFIQTYSFYRIKRDNYKSKVEIRIWKNTRNKGKDG